MKGIGNMRWVLALLVALVAALGVAACGENENRVGAEDAATPAAGSEGENKPVAPGGAATPAADVKQYPSDSVLGRIQEKGEITIGVKYDVPPFGFKNPQTNSIEGFDVDLGRAVAQELGVKPKLIEAISDNRIPFLEDGTADLILSTMTINAERVEQIDFSDPYFIAKGRILVKDDSDIAGIDDLAGKKVCTALGSTYEATLKKQAPKADLRLVDSYSECLELIQNGAVEAVSTDDVILTGMIIQDETLKLVGEELTQEPYGAGIKKGNKELTDFVNQVFTKYKQDGRWQKTYDKWVGQYTKQQAQPPMMSVEEAVKLTQ